LEPGNGSTEDISARVIDLVSPIGKGQRGLIVSPPKAGKTILQNIAQSIARNNPECYLIVLLIDERPEEVTEMQRIGARRSDRQHLRRAADPPCAGGGNGDREGQAAGRAQDGCGDPARLDHPAGARLQHRGALLGQGADRRRRCQRAGPPKRFFGAARNIEEGGSLTIIATALIDTGSKMDEVIYEEFKGTGNMEIHLDRRISEKRIFPAINIRRSGTRREELLTSEDELQRMWILRKLLQSMDDLDAIEFLVDKLRQTKSNDEFFASMKRK
jgi:transcription termination factor Rho